MVANTCTLLTMFVILRSAGCETSKEPLQDVSSQSTLKSNLDYVPTPDTWEANPNLKSLWVYRPPPLQSEREQTLEFHPAYLKGPYSLTRLAKPLTFGFDPYFKKGYFEPFERRQRPVTLVAFRRNGLLPRRSIKIEESKSEDVAEMQSPYNEISSFWENEPGFISE